MLLGWNFSKYNNSNASKQWSHCTTVEDEYSSKAKQLSIPRLQNSLTNRKIPVERGKMRENPKFYRHSVQLMHQSQNQHFVEDKNRFKQGELEAETNQHVQNVFVKQIIMKIISAKTSLLHFLN